MGSLAAILPRNDPHVYYIGQDMHVYELRWGSAWHYLDLTNASGSPVPPAPRTPLAAFSRDDNAHVYCIGQDMHVYELRWEGGWHYLDLMNASGVPVYAKY